MKFKHLQVCLQQRCLLPAFLALCHPFSETAAQSVDLPPELKVKLMPTVLITGTQGSTVSVQFATEIGGLSNWITLTNLTLPTGESAFVDGAAGDAEKRFYRAVADLPPPPANPSSDRFVALLPGSFIMGTPPNQMFHTQDEGPQTHVVFTYWFFMDKHEVTQAQYEQLMGTNPSKHTGNPNRPVDSVSWEDATNYCARLTAAISTAGKLPAGYTCRLPTEAEWEYACRAGTATRFSFGDNLDDELRWKYAWHDGNSSKTTHPVGTKLPNAWGLFDMHGNVAEHCWPIQRPLPGGRVVNPEGVPTWNLPYLRGGSFLHFDPWGASGARRLTMDGDSNDTGFRVVIAPPLPW